MVHVQGYLILKNGKNGCATVVLNIMEHGGVKYPC